MNYFNNYFQNISYRDDFGHDPTWNNEMDKWLEYIFKLDRSFYERNKKRVTSEKQRDEFLGEIKSIYFIGKILGLEITELEPPGTGLRLLDFNYKDLKKNLWRTEVKSPSWRAKVFKSTGLTQNDKIARIRMPQFIEEKPEFINPETEVKIAITDAIKNALPKFKKGDSNLLIITPNMDQQLMVMMAIQSMTGTNNVVQDEVRAQDINKVISVVLILEPMFYLSKGKVEYYYKFLPM